MIFITNRVNIIIPIRNNNYFMNTNLYPLKFQSLLKEKIWGGTKMERILGKKIAPMTHCGESWEVSGLIGDESVVKNGFLADNNLNELIEVYLTELVGEQIYEKFGFGFPLLIKFIDACENLSVQVHPDDALAKRKYGQNGKTEMWHVVQADPGSGLYIGFKKKITAEQYENAVGSGALSEILQFYPVAAGDTFLIPAGTVHAIGKGILLAEIQQPSDVTFRIFDWNRVDAAGNTRELHTEEAIEAIHFQENTGNFKLPYQLVHNQTVSIIRSPFFNVNILECDSPLHKSYLEIDSFVLYICLEGTMNLVFRDGNESLTKGEVVLKPAEMEELQLIPAPHAKILEIYCS